MLVIAEVIPISKNLFCRIIQDLTLQNMDVKSSTLESEYIYSYI